MVASFHILSNLSYTYYPFIPRCVVFSYWKCVVKDSTKATSSGTKLICVVFRFWIDVKNRNPDLYFCVLSLKNAQGRHTAQTLLNCVRVWSHIRGVSSSWKCLVPTLILKTSVLTTYSCRDFLQLLVY
jgi:hypothetical protein